MMQTRPDNLTKFLAVWGALLSTLGMGWNLYRDLHDRARLKVVAHLRRIAPSGSATGQLLAHAPHLPIIGTSEQMFVFVDVTNVGRRPVRWDGWGGKYYDKVGGKDSFVIIPVALPKLLHEGESHSEFTAELHQDVNNVKKIFIWDAAGKNWKLPRRELKKLKRAVRKQIELEQQPSSNSAG